MPKFAAFRYDESPNLGDTIQTLAVEQFLPRVDRYIDLYHLSSVPAIFFGDPHEYRVGLLAELGVPVNRLPNLVARYLYLLPRGLKWRYGNRPGVRRFSNSLREWARRAFINRRVDWDPEPVDLEAEKRQMIAQIRQAIRDKAGA